jgi:7-cyano-7-deazaguanine synthase in queuosine biosynthesis
MSAFELRPSISAAQTTDRQDLAWPTEWRAHEASLWSDLTPWLSELGLVTDPAIDLVRIATGAFLADQRTRRPRTFSRSIDIAVQLADPAPWDDEVLGEIADLLESVSGDNWTVLALEAHQDVRMVPPDDAEVEPVHRIALLSGGLDSFAGAAISSEPGGVAYIGHADNPIVRGAQNRVARRFRDEGRPLDYTQIYHALGTDKLENSTRSRALLFMSLGVALATARQASVVEIPENGFTSLNPPLGPERGGALSTRSTHPMTIARFNAVLERVGIPVRVENPYQWFTKGELVAAAAPHLPNFEAGAAETLSCAKLDGARIKGGNAHHHCGLCFACIVRRGAMLADGVPDRTPYLSNTLPATSLPTLHARRGSDIDGVKMLLLQGVDEAEILALGPFPDSFDLDANIGRAVDLCRRGIDELARVRLP